jgi:AraC-like DNA-binding protein
MNLSHYVPLQAGFAGNPRLSVARFGLREQLPAQLIHRPVGNNDYLLMLFHTPSVVGSAPGAAEFPAGTFIMWEPQQSHFYGNAHRRWDHSWAHFSGSEPARLIGKSRVPKNTPVLLAEPHLFERFLQAVQGEITAHSSPDTGILASHLHILLRELERSLEGGGGTVVPAEFLELKAWLDTHYQLPIRLSELADRTFLSVPRFCASFKRHFGYPAIDYVMRLRMQHAAFMLRDVNMRVKQVAESVGCSDLYYFSKLFRRHHGLSPRAFRARIRS